MGLYKGQALPYLICELCKTRWGVDDISFHDVLYKLYVEEGLSMRSIAKQFRVSTSTVLRWLREQGITRTKLKC